MQSHYHAWNARNLCFINTSVTSFGMIGKVNYSEPYFNVFDGAYNKNEGTKVIKLTSIQKSQTIYNAILDSNYTIGWNKKCRNSFECPESIGNWSSNQIRSNPEPEKPEKPGDAKRVKRSFSLDEYTALQNDD